MIHMLYYHGIAFESHAQNMMLIHENGWPTRIALKISMMVFVLSVSI